jgi:hypothetical protein
MQNLTLIFFQVSLNLIGDSKNGHQIVTYCLDTDQNETLIRTRGADDVQSLLLLQPSASSRSVTPTSPTTPLSPRPPASPQPTLLSNGSSKKNIFTAFHGSVKMNSGKNKNNQRLSVENLVAPQKNGAKTPSPSPLHKTPTFLFNEPQPKLNRSKNSSFKHVTPSKTLRKQNSMSYHPKDNVGPPNLQSNTQAFDNLGSHTNQSSSDDESHKKYGLFKKLSFKLRRSKKSPKEKPSDDGLVDPALDIEGLQALCVS